MAIQYAPMNGVILICDFTGIVPEMVKRRPVVLLPSVSPRLGIVVPLSTTWPQPPMPWHYLLRVPEPLPGPYKDLQCWVKGDMVATVSFDRLSLPFKGKDKNGKRIYQITQIPGINLESIRTAVCRAVSGSC